MNAPAKIKQGDATAIDTFAEAVVKLQSAIKPAIKDAQNDAFKRGGKASRYADLSAVWEAVKEPLKENGFAVIQIPQFEGDTMYLETILLHVSGDKLSGRYPLRPSKQDPQGYGSAITYARRYALSAMLGVIADEDDDGNAASNVTPPAQMRAPQAAPTDGEDADVVEGVKNWVAKQKTIIDACERIPDLYMWADENCLGGTPSDPDTGSILYRLKKKAPEAHKEIAKYYQAKFESMGRKQ